MKRCIPVLLLALLSASCNGWVIQPGPTPFLPPTNTPSIFTATPVVIGVSTATPTPQIATPTATTVSPVFPTATFTPTLIATNTSDFTSSPSGPSVTVQVLGCNTSLDVTHGMGEVTNAFVVLRNTGGIELTNLKVTLKALDEGREHPDKTVEVTSLPLAHKVSLKLTVDSTYQEETPIQVEVIGDAGLFQRVGAEACKDIGLFAPNPDALNTPVPDDA